MIESDEERIQVLKELFIWPKMEDQKVYFYGRRQAAEEFLNTLHSKSDSFSRRKSAQEPVVRYLLMAKPNILSGG